MSGVRSFLVGVLKGVYRIASKQALGDWAEENIVLSKKESIDNPGPYKQIHSIAPPRLIDEFMRDPQWRTLMVMKSSQSAFTLNVLILCCRKIAEAAGNILYVIDTAAKARKLSQRRLMPMLKTCKATKLAVEENEDDLSNLSYNLPNGYMTLAGAQSAGALASDPYGLVIFDEADKAKITKGEAHPWLLIISRIKNSEDGKALGFSTPTVETAITNKAFQTGSQHRYHLPCPHCGHRFALELDQLQFGHARLPDGSWDFDVIINDTWCKCPECGGRSEEDDKFEMLLAGKWKPTNYREVEVDGKKRRVKNWAPGEMSAHYSDLYSLHPNSTWGKIALEFVQAQGDSGKLHDFNNNRLGLPDRQSIAEATDRHVLRLCGRYDRGWVPVQPCIAGMAVDNQADHTKWVRGAFMPNGDLYVVDYGVGGALLETDEVLKQPIKAPNGDIYPQRCIIDEGGAGGTSYDVRKFCFSRFPVCFPAKGRAGVQLKNVVWWTSSKLERGGMDEVPVCHFDDDAFKRQLYINRIARFDEKAAEEQGLPRLFLPRDIGSDFIRELLGEKFVKELDRRGAPVYRWVQKPPNDYGDCIKMLLVLWNNIGHEFAQIKTGEAVGAEKKE